MKGSYLTRLKKIEKQAAGQPQPEMALLDNGGILEMPSIMDYIFLNGRETPHGLIVDMILPAGEMDAISMAIYDFERELARGEINLDGINLC